jgi:4-hydroxy-2-oxoheptanedioate aldolase
MTGLKEKLTSSDAVLSTQVCVIPSAVVSQAIAATGIDCIVIDQEHGPIDYEALHAMIASTQGTSCAALVRVPEVSESYVKRALDAGAEGICFPMIRTASDAERCVSSMRYAPSGKRGWGPFVAHSRWRVPLFDYVQFSGQAMVCMLLIETPDAVENIDAICAVDGVDCLILAPFDLSTELGISGQLGHPKMVAAAMRVERAAMKAGIPLGGVAATKEAAQELIRRKYRMVCGFDLLLLKSAVIQSRGWIERE